MRADRRNDKRVKEKGSLPHPLLNNAFRTANKRPCPDTCGNFVTEMKSVTPQ